MDRSTLLACILQQQQYFKIHFWDVLRNDQIILY